MLMANDPEFGWKLNYYRAGDRFSVLARSPAESERVCEVLGGGRDSRAAQSNRGHGNQARKVGTHTRVHLSLSHTHTSRAGLQ